MRALFVTTPTPDCHNHVRAWNSFAESEHHVFDPNGIRNCWQSVEAARACSPDYIFYIGPVHARAVPRPETFKELRTVAPLVSLVSDAADWPWHKPLRYYSKHECFDLQVSIDGAKEAPVDHATLTPVDPAPFRGKKTIRCGFSGTLGGPRAAVVRSLEWFAGVEVRTELTSYEDHAAFMSSCQLSLNVSYTGTAQGHHIKGRVMEAAWAKSALLEPAESLIGDWFPEDCYFTYKDPPEAAELIECLPDEMIAERAARMYEEVSNRFTAEMIYTGITERVRRSLQG